MKYPLLIKVSFWMVIIGLAAQLTPNPAWPLWLARLVLAGGVALFVATIFDRWRSQRKKP